MNQNLLIRRKLSEIAIHNKQVLFILREIFYISKFSRIPKKKLAGYPANSLSGAILPLCLISLTFCICSFS